MNIYNTYNRLLSKFLLLTVIILATSFTVFGEAPNKIVITGQVINYEYGNPVEGHKVIVETYNDFSDRSIKELITDEEGYYHDTIVTNLNKGSYIISTYDYKGKKIDTTVHYRVLNLVSFNVIIANFRIYMPWHPEVVQAKFNYYQREGESRFLYTFRDLTESEDIVKWHWDFGDGTTSNLQNNIHTFAKPGVYKVSLTVTVRKNTKTESNTITSLIYISDRSFVHLGGHAFADYFPIDKGLAYLYLIDSSNNYIPVDTVKFDTLGFYIFYQIPTGNYIVKAQPDKESAFYGDLIPTYFGDKLFWEEASIIDLNNTNWENDIHLIHGQEMKTGDCLVEGQVVYSNLGSALGNLPAPMIDLYLMDENNNTFVSHYSGEEGEFDFSAIPAGKYKIYPELTGIETHKITAELDDEGTIINDLTIVLGPQGPDFIFENQVKSELISNIYPNPATDKIAVELNKSNTSEIIISIVDLSGRKVFENIIPPFANQKSIINIADLNRGVYVLKLQSGTKFDSRKIIIK